MDVEDLGVDLMTLSAHKLHGPKGVGALYVRKGVILESLVHGGGQESGLRSGTENVLEIAGFGKAMEKIPQYLISVSAADIDRRAGRTTTEPFPYALPWLPTRSCFLLNILAREAKSHR